MLPLFKVFSLVVRILARPLISKTKAATSSRLQDVRLRAFFICLGNRTHKINVIINRKFLKLNNTDFKVQELGELAALELGVETFYEIIIYACLLGLPFLEIYFAYVEGLEKAEKDKKTMEDIHTKLIKLDEQQSRQALQIQHLNVLNDLLRTKSSLLEEAILTKSLFKKQNPNHEQIIALEKEVQNETKAYKELIKKGEL